MPGISRLSSGFGPGHKNSDWGGNWPNKCRTMRSADFTRRMRGEGGSRTMWTMRAPFKVFNICDGPRWNRLQQGVREAGAVIGHSPPHPPNITIPTELGTDSKSACYNPPKMRRTTRIWKGDSSMSLRNHGWSFLRSNMASHISASSHMIDNNRCFNSAVVWSKPAKRPG